MAREISKYDRTLRIIFRLGQLNDKAQTQAQLRRLRLQVSRLWNWIDVSEVGYNSNEPWYLLLLFAPKAYRQRHANGVAFEYYQLDQHACPRYLGGSEE